MSPTEVSDATWTNKLFVRLWERQHPNPVQEALHWASQPPEFWTNGRPPSHILAKAIMEERK